MLKRLWTTFTPGLALGALFVTAAHAADALPLVSDGGFETPPGGLGPWKLSVTGDAHAAITAGHGAPSAVLTHDHALALSYTGHTGKAGISQKLTDLQPGHNYAVNYLVSRSKATGQGPQSYNFAGYCAASFLGENDRASQPFFIFGPGYATFSQHLTASAKTETLRIGATAVSSTKGIHIDDISLTDVTPTPEVDARYGLLPTAFAAALLLLLGESRKRN